MILETPDALAAEIPDGITLAIPPDYSFVPMELVRALIRRQVKDLHLLAVPITGLPADLLIGAGAVRLMEAAAVSLGEAGLAPRFSRAVETGALKMRDSTCPAVHTALQAAEKGVPFMPLSGLIGSDILRFREDWVVAEDPLGTGQGPIVLIPAIKPDVAILHAPLGDRFGNVWVGKRRELFTMAHAARTTFATVERLQDEDLLEDPVLSAGTLSNLYVESVAIAEGGAKPLGLEGQYTLDLDHLRAYGGAARSDDGFQAYLREHVFTSDDHAGAAAE